MLVDIFEAALLEAEAEAKPLLVEAALAAREPLLEPEEAALDDATAVASAALPVMAPGPWLPVAV